MPIDLKWVRQDPQQVEEWQIVRRRRKGGGKGENGGATSKDKNDNEGCDEEENDDEDAKSLVQDVLRKDATSRQYLQQLLEERRRRTRLLQQLRPPLTNTKKKNNDDDKQEEEEGIQLPSSSKQQQQQKPFLDDLLIQKKESHNQICKLEHLWKVSVQETERALNILASPVDLMEFRPSDKNHVPEVVYYSNDDDHDDESNDDGVESSSTRYHYYYHHRRCHRHRCTNHSETTVAGTRQALDLQQAFYRYTLLHFRKYSSWIKLPDSGLAVEGAGAAGATTDCPPGGNNNNNNDSKKSCTFSSNGTTLSLDRAHALWGGNDWKRRDEGTNAIDREIDNDTIINGNNGDNNPSSAPGALSLAEVGSTPPPSSSSTIVVVLPTWMRLLVEYLPPKTIWGDKQLPAYTAVWSTTMPCIGIPTTTTATTTTTTTTMTTTSKSSGRIDGFSTSSFSLELVALTASSVVDARQIQSNFVSELITFYENLLIPMDYSTSSDSTATATTTTTAEKTTRLRWRQVPPSRLHPHEWSRIEILIAAINEDRTCPKPTKTTTSNPIDEKQYYVLGCVSHWGDAASRACDMAFAGNGSNGVATNSTTPKEYVHIVQASIVDSCTWTTMLHCNCRTMSNSNSNNNNKHHKNHLGEMIQVGVPPAIACHLLDPIEGVQQDVPYSAPIWLPWKELMVPDINGSKKNKKHQTIFGSLMENWEQVHHHQEEEDIQRPNRDTPAKVSITDRLAVGPKFPPLTLIDIKSNRHQDIDYLSNLVRGEALSSPFDFLFK